MIKRIIALVAVFTCVSALFAGGSQERAYSIEAFQNAISQKVGHRLDESEKAVSEATYNWYSEKYGKKMSREQFDHAIEKGVENCENDAMIAAAKAGKFGEKLLKALVVSAGDAAEKFSTWVDKTSERYDRENK
jgi:hypothetical protein